MIETISSNQQEMSSLPVLKLGNTEKRERAFGLQNNKILTQIVYKTKQTLWQNTSTGNYKVLNCYH